MGRHFRPNKVKLTWEQGSDPNDTARSRSRDDFKVYLNKEGKLGKDREGQPKSGQVGTHRCEAHKVRRISWMCPRPVSEGRREVLLRRAGGENLSGSDRRDTEQAAAAAAHRQAVKTTHGKSSGRQCPRFGTKTNGQRVNVKTMARAFPTRKCQRDHEEATNRSTGTPQDFREPNEGHSKEAARPEFRADAPASAGQLRHVRQSRAVDGRRRPDHPMSPRQENDKSTARRQAPNKKPRNLREDLVDSLRKIRETGLRT